MGIRTSLGRWRRVALVLFIGLALGACKKKDDEGDKADKGDSDSLAAEAAADDATEKNFTGKWKTAWGIVRLDQTGTKIKGSFNGQFTGTLSGSVSGQKASLKWVQTNGENGRCKFTLSAGGDSFKGTWGSGSSTTNGGPWNGTRDGASAVGDTIGGGL